MNSSAIPLIVIVVLMLAMVGCNAAVAHGTKDTVDFKVVRLERVTSGSGDGASSKYLVFTDGETFENTDSLWHGKFNSSDVYGHLQVGKHYRANVYGWRIPFMSSYRNIIDVEPHDAE